MKRIFLLIILIMIGINYTIVALEFNGQKEWDNHLNIEKRQDIDACLLNARGNRQYLVPYLRNYYYTGQMETLEKKIRKIYGPNGWSDFNQIDIHDFTPGLVSSKIKGVSSKGKDHFTIHYGNDNAVDFCMENHRYVINLETYKNSMDDPLEIMTGSFFYQGNKLLDDIDLFPSPVLLADLKQSMRSSNIDKKTKLFYGHSCSKYILTITSKKHFSKGTLFPQARYFVQLDNISPTEIKVNIACLGDSEEKEIFADFSFMVKVNALGNIENIDDDKSRSPQQNIALFFAVSHCFIPIPDRSLFLDELWVSPLLPLQEKKIGAGFKIFQLNNIFRTEHETYLKINSTFSDIIKNDKQQRLYTGHRTIIYNNTKGVITNSQAEFFYQAMDASIFYEESILIDVISSNLSIEDVKKRYPQSCLK